MTIENTLLLISVISNIVIAIVTIAYVVYTRYLVKVSQKAYRHQLAPVVGIEVGEIKIGKEYGSGRRNLSVAISLKNVGNAPAIEVLVDSEIEYRYSEINGERSIPARFEPSFVPYLLIGETATGRNIAQSYGNTFIAALLDDAREANRLNTHRIVTDPTQEAYKMSVLKIYVYYRNALGQSFRSCYVQEVCVWGSDDIEKDELVLTKIFIPRPKFETKPIGEKEKMRELEARNQKRELCGW